MLQYITGQHEVVLPDQINVTCGYSGFPSPILTIIAPGLTSQEVISMSTTDTGTLPSQLYYRMTSLIIPRSSRSNNGTYICTATTPAATLITQTSVTVLEVPDAPLAPSLTKNVAFLVGIAWQLPLENNAAIDNYTVLFSYQTCLKKIVTNATVLPPYLLRTSIPVNANQTYRIRVRAANRIGFGPYSPALDVETVQSAPFGAPRTVKAVAASPSTINFTWADVACGEKNGLLVKFEASYYLQTKIPGSTASPTAMAGSVVVSSNTFYIVITGLLPSTWYLFDVRAWTSVGPSPFSKTISQRTLTPDNRLPPRAVALHQTVIGVQHRPLTLAVKLLNPGIPAVELMGITWSKVGQTSWLAANKRYLSSDYLNLTIPAVIYRVAGQYFVELGNSAGKVKVNFTVHYQEPASMTQTLKGVSVNQGGNAIFSCIAHGNPVPIVTFYHNTSQLSPALYTMSSYVDLATVQRGVYATLSTLTLTNVSNNASQGTYSCEASNIHPPSVKSSASLDVHVPPRQLSPPKDVVSNRGGTVQFVCNMYGITNPRLTWFHDGKDLHTSQAFLSNRVHLSKSASILNITNVQYIERGDYHCFADNTNPSKTWGGTVSGTPATLTVYVLPSGAPDKAVQVGLRGDQVTLKAVVTHQGHPPVPYYNITWSKKFDSQWSALSPLYSLSASGHSLTFFQMNHNDAGDYTVKLGNLAGEVRLDFTLTYAERPEILTPPSTQRVNQDTDVILYCVASGLPTPNIYWMYNSSSGHTLQYVNMEQPNTAVNLRGSFVVNSTLTIPSVQNDVHQGNYTCVVENIHKPDAQATAYVHIYVPAVQLLLTANQSVLAGNTAVLKCNVYGVPTPTVEWYKRGLVSC
ncbi:hemicentin-1-like [Sycon ciliatum]|uniref:hemicentin-1-like n=1 Tax=Sycon ciliatum TaxID=27933 RepID=UPI0031F6B1E2